MNQKKIVHHDCEVGWKKRSVASKLCAVRKIIVTDKFGSVRIQFDTCMNSYYHLDFEIAIIINVSVMPSGNASLMTLVPFAFYI